MYLDTSFPQSGHAGHIQRTSLEQCELAQCEDATKPVHTVGIFILRIVGGGTQEGLIGRAEAESCL